MENHVGYRLSLEEIIFLSASLTQSKTIFGLRNKPLPTEQKEIRWERVKKGLLDKQLLSEKEGVLTVCSNDLSQMIYAISSPKILAAIRAGTGSSSSFEKQKPLTRFYIRGTLAVAVDNDLYADDYYLIKSYAKNSEVQEALKDIIQLDGYNFKASDDYIEADIATLGRLLSHIKEDNADQALNLINSKGISIERARDLYNALNQKKRLLSLVCYAFDPAYNGGRRAAREMMLYEGNVYIWEVLISEDTASIRVAGKDDVWDELRIISRLMDFV